MEEFTHYGNSRAPTSKTRLESFCYEAHLMGKTAEVKLVINSINLKKKLQLNLLILTSVGNKVKPASKLFHLQPSIA